MKTTKQIDIHLDTFVGFGDVLTRLPCPHEPVILYVNGIRVLHDDVRCEYDPETKENVILWVGSFDLDSNDRIQMIPGYEDVVTILARLYEEE